jgi:predicted HTH transcriptional regulator
MVFSENKCFQFFNFGVSSIEGTRKSTILNQRTKHMNNELHRKIARFIENHPKLSRAQVATTLNISEGTVYNIIREFDLPYRISGVALNVNMDALEEVSNDPTSK